jgi:predicted dinucleotide-binding enzyme
MKVAIIGTGNVGKALGGTAKRAGHAVTLAARDAEKTRTVAEELGTHAAETPAEAADQADVIILAVPFGALADVAAEIADGAQGKVVVDATNPLKPDYSGLATDGGPSGAEQLAEKLPGARVAKAFNTLFGSLQADPQALGTKLDAPYATDDAEARRELARLIDSLGFRPVDTGSLQAARQMEALAWLNMQLQMKFGGDWRSAFVLVGAPEAATTTTR